MYSFKNDYSEGAHPKLLEALVKSNLYQTVGYGEDEYCELARGKIRDRFQIPNAAIHFLAGGTQTNQTLIASVLRPYQAVISAVTGHINVHETGAIEATGHKVLTVDGTQGKVNMELLEYVLAAHQNEHMVQPKLVYLSNSTELGTIYLKQELEELYAFCQENNLYLYMDGARLGSALTSSKNDLKAEDLVNVTDAFSIGGTKNGALFGEALVIVKEELQKDFRYHLKQRGGMLAKGRLLGVQFLELFENDLFFYIAEHANNQAEKLRKGIEKKGIPFLSESRTNQLFPVLSDKKIAELSEDFLFEYQQRVDSEHSCIRLVTSWATTDESVGSFLYKF